MPEPLTITGRTEQSTGTYFNLSDGAQVKARLLPGKPYVCLRCLANECRHIAAVAEVDTPEAEAAHATR